MSKRYVKWIGNDGTPGGILDCDEVSLIVVESGGTLKVTLRGSGVIQVWEKSPDLAKFLSEKVWEYWEEISKD